VPLLDAPLSLKEFKSRRMREAARKQRWPTLLTGSALVELEGVCDGARKLESFRKQCCGYFMAE